MLKSIMFRKSKRTGYQICFILLYLYIYMYLICFFVVFFLLVWNEALRPSQQFFSHVWTEPPLPGYYQCFLGGKCILLKDTTRRPE